MLCVKQQLLLMEKLMFQKNEFKKAKEWLQSNNYPLDLIKGIIDFNIVDLANLMFEAENNLNGKELRDGRFRAKRRRIL